MSLWDFGEFLHIHAKIPIVGALWVNEKIKVWGKNHLLIFTFNRTELGRIKKRGEIVFKIKAAVKRAPAEKPK
jgi:hypothetical protein